MDKIVIRGGKPLHGEVYISGSKNSSLPCLFATLLTDEECILHHVPDLVDIETTCSLLTKLGKKIKRDGQTIVVSPGNKLHAEASYDLVRRMRASALVLGPLLARLGMARASLPGGCAIGMRPIDIHLAGLEALGAKTNLESGMVELQCKRLKGRRFRLNFPSVGATENLLMAASLASGVTILENVAREPEIVDLAVFLKKMGAQISGAGTTKIQIQGQEKLHGAVHTVIPDRIETATYIIAAAITGGKIFLTHVEPNHVQAILTHLKKTGTRIKISKSNEGTHSTIRVEATKKIQPVSVATGPYPKFPTDVQAQWMALMSLARGKSMVVEKIFESRHLHAAELMRMGANIKTKGRVFYIEGVAQLKGADVMVSDLRAGAALVLAGLAAQGQTVIHRIYHLDRGYEELEHKFKNLGADIKRVT